MSSKTTRAKAKIAKASRKKRSAMFRSANTNESRFLTALDSWHHPEDQSQWQDATEGFRLQAWQGGRLKVDVACGETKPIYDWASLTKIVVSVSNAMIEVEEGDLSIRDRLSDWLPEIAGGGNSKRKALSKKALGEFRSLRVRDLLTHSAGMTWWKPFYKSVAAKSPRDHEEAWAILSELVVRDVRTRLENGEIAKARKGPAIYSDLDFFLLGEVLRRSSLLSIPDQYARVQERLGLENTFYHALSKRDLVAHDAATRQAGVVWHREDREHVAPTEVDFEWRGRLLQGEVHDENASSLFGIAPHAGLFGPIEDLSRYGLEVRKLARGEKSRLPSIGREFVKRSVPRARGDWGLGFMMPTKGGASCGPKFSLSSVGHSGFTGTSLWYDPKQDLLVTILSNRVHPTRKNSRFVRLRPALHTFVVEALL